MNWLKTHSDTFMQKTEKPLDLSPPLYFVVLLRFLEWVYPPAAVKIALKYFYTPIPFKRPDREAKTFEQAKRQELMIGRKRITVYTWGKADKKILLVHGWSGRATQFYKIKNYLLSRGFQVIAFDAPAHGENKDAKTTHMLEFVESIERVNMTFGPFYGAIGHSLGGLAILNAYNKGFKVEKIAVIAAPSSIANVVRDFCQRIKAGEKTEKGIVANLIAEYQVPLEHYSGQEQAPTVKANGLIVHDIHDHDVSVEEGRMLNKSWKSSRLHLTKRLGHRRVLRDKFAVPLIADFFGKRKPGRPKPQRKPTRNNDQKTDQGKKGPSSPSQQRPKPQPRPRPQNPENKAEEGRGQGAQSENKPRVTKSSPKQEDNKKQDNQNDNKPRQQRRRPSRKPRPQPNKDAAPNKQSDAKKVGEPGKQNAPNKPKSPSGGKPDAPKKD